MRIATLFEKIGWLAAGGVCVALQGCMPTNDQLRTRAAFDMQCPETQLQIIDLDAQTRGVVGCGKRMTYVGTCNGQPGNIGTTCNWVANVGASQAMSSGPQASPASSGYIPKPAPPPEPSPPP